MNTVTVLSLGRIGIGAASLVKPAWVASQMTPGAQAGTPLLTQWFGSREIALGAATLLTRGTARRTLVLIGVGVDTADAATAYAAMDAKTLPTQVGLGLVGIASGAVLGGLLGLRVRTQRVLEPV